MRFCIVIFLFVLFSVSTHGQSVPVTEKGEVSYVSSQNIYVKFPSTEPIAVGDTLFVKKGELLHPVLVVSNKSSTSCVCSPLTSDKIEISDEIIAITAKKKVEEIAEIEEELETEEETISPQEEIIAEVSSPPDEDVEPEFKQKIRGRISAASYSNLSDYGDRHRMRYGFSFRGNNLNNSRYSIESNIIFRHNAGEWSEVQDNLASALKVYALAARYDFDQSSNVTLGRRINPKLSSMGAIDGVQYEKGVGNLTFGAIAGTRPDYSDYGFNLDLLQAGAFISHSSDKRYQLSTLAFAEQRNGGAVDRRFVYFQHSSNPVKNLNLFGSFEMDMYQNINGEVKNEPRLTNLYVSARYRFSRKFNFSLSYDNRQNIIYYESYKGFIDNLIEQETRQGLRAGISVRPMKFVTFGANGSWRFQKSDMNLSKNLNTYLNISRVPGIDARLSLRANFLQTNYLDSKIFGVRMSKDIVKGKVGSELYFRMVDYQYRESSYSIQQKVVGANLNLRITKKLSLYLYGERTFDNLDRNLTRINAKIIQRF